MSVVRKVWMKKLIKISATEGCVQVVGSTVVHIHDVVQLDLIECAGHLRLINFSHECDECVLYSIYFEE